MPRFFIEPREVSPGDIITLSGEDARHISFSLRARVGEEYTLCDTCNYEYKCRITSISAEDVSFSVVEKMPAKAEPDVCVTLYQALIKGDKFDEVVQKAVELGVMRIVPVISERCVSRPDDKSVSKKIERWRKIAKAAAMQSARALLPEVSDLITYNDALLEIKNADCGFVCYEAEPHEPIKEIFKRASEKSKAKSYSFFVGPEGGLSENEAKKAGAAGIPLASLGKRILRTETAPLCVISAVMFFSDNLN